MSAIFGVINKDGKPVDEHSINAMQQSMIHRAVDGRSVWQTGGAFLGHHKLVVSPFDKNEQMPYEEGDLVITADAGLHNRGDLCARLGSEQKSNDQLPDSLLILAAYKKWGERCLDYLDGEFAFVIWNKVSGNLFCAIDHIGFRPLYYYDSLEMFAFSSEMKGILAVKKTPNIFNEEILVEYFFRQCDQSKTYNSELFALCGGHKLIMSDGKVRVEQYWTLQQTGKYHFIKDSDWAVCLRELLIAAVGNRMQIDERVGVTLSGGLDSSSIACIAGKILEKKNKPLYAFSSVLPLGHQGVEVDERNYIGILGKHIRNLEQTFVEAPGKSPFTDIEKAFETDEMLPNAFSYMDQALNKAAAEKGVKLLLSGFGGDFFVSWKGNSVVYQLLNQFHLVDAAKIFFETKRYEHKSVIQLVKTDVVAFSGFYKALAPLLHRRKVNWRYYTTLKDDFSRNYQSKLTYGVDTDQVAFMFDQVNKGHISRLTGLYSNRDAAYGMATAMPMFDRHIMEFLMDVPVAQHRVNGVRRSLIRRAMDGILPPEIQWRNDKFPYSPDYIARVKASTQLINSITSSHDHDLAWRYIDKERIMANIDGLKPVAGMGLSSEVAGIRIIQGIISCLFIRWLMNNEYSFNK